MSRSALVARWALINSAVAATYAIIGLAFTTVAWLGLAVPMWPGAGLAFAVALRWGPRVLPGIFLGSLAANVVAQSLQGGRGTFLTAVLIGLGAAAQAQVAAWLVRRFTGGEASLTTARNILLFLLLAGPIASIVAATVGTAAQLTSGVLTSAQAPLAWLVWWAGDSMGVIVFGPVTLMLLPGSHRLWRGWRARVAVPSLVFAGALLAALELSQHAAQTQLQADRAQAALDASARVVNQLDRQQEVLQGIKSLFEASDEVSPEEFRSFTRESLEQYSSLQALSWNAALSADQLDAFETQRRAEPGGESFTVTERDPDGKLQPVARDRDLYVVVEYIEPLAENRAALGYDIQSNPERAKTIAEATVTGESIATPPIDLVQSDGDSQKGMLVLDPAYETFQVPETVKARKASLIGFSVGVYKFDDMFREVFEGQLDSAQWSDVSLELIDVTNPAEPMIIAARPAAGVTPEQTAAAPRVLSAPVMVDGRTWQVALMPIRGHLADSAAAWAPLSLIAAVAVLFLLEALLLVLVGGERRARAEAETMSFEAEHDELTGLLNRRGFTRRLEQLCTATGKDSAAHMLLFCDLDDFKGVNDRGGHVIGDDMLVQTGQMMQSQIRESDILARIGGDEFAVILVNCPQGKGIQIAESIVQSVDTHRLTTPRGSFTVGVSIGATTIGGGNSTDPEQVIQNADDAAYDAKQRGGGTVVLATGDPQHIVIDALTQRESSNPRM